MRKFIGLVSLLVRDGLSQQVFETTRESPTKYSNVPTQTQSARLGCALFSRFFE